MNLEIETLLADMIAFKRDFKPNGFLVEVAENMETSVLSTLITDLFMWQKDILLGIDSDDDFKEDRMLIDSISHGYYESMFTYCPQLLGIFHLDKEAVLYNESLTEDDKLEIREYVHQNFEITVRITLRRKK